MVFEILLDPSPQNMSQKLNFLRKFFKKVDLALESGSVKFSKWSQKMANLM
jgi:hypothetical protein